jgi:hypothetical protein
MRARTKIEGKESAARKAIASEDVTTVALQSVTAAHHHVALSVGFLTEGAAHERMRALD